MAKISLQSAIQNNVKTTLSNTYSSTENIKQQIVVLDELQSWIPAPTPEEYKQLEVNIVTNGCRDSLILWETTHQQAYPDSQTPNEPLYILIDGHNRYRICKSRNISFNIQLMDFFDLKSVKDFMIDLQLGRRNLTLQQIAYFRGLRYLNEKSEKGKYNRQNEMETFHNSVQKKESDQSISFSKSESTAEKLAKEYKVGRNTIIRDAEFAAGVEQLAPELKQSVLAGSIKVEKAQVQKLSKIQVYKPVQNIDELKKVVSKSNSAPIPDNKNEFVEGKTSTELASQNRVKYEEDLNKLMKNLLGTTEYNLKQIEQLIEKALLLKTLLAEY